MLHFFLLSLMSISLYSAEPAGCFETLKLTDKLLGEVLSGKHVDPEELEKILSITLRLMDDSIEENTIKQIRSNLGEDFVVDVSNPDFQRLLAYVQGELEVRGVQVRLEHSELYEQVRLASERFIPHVNKDILELAWEFFLLQNKFEGGFDTNKCKSEIQRIESVWKYLDEKNRKVVKGFIKKQILLDCGDGEHYRVNPTMVPRYNQFCIMAEILNGLCCDLVKDKIFHDEWSFAQAIRFIMQNEESFCRDNLGLLSDTTDFRCDACEIFKMLMHKRVSVICPIGSSIPLLQTRVNNNKRLQKESRESLELDCMSRKTELDNNEHFFRHRLQTKFEDGLIKIEEAIIREEVLRKKDQLRRKIRCLEWFDSIRGMFGIGELTLKPYQVANRSRFLRRGQGLGAIEEDSDEVVRLRKAQGKLVFEKQMCQSENLRMENQDCIVHKEVVRQARIERRQGRVNDRADIIEQRRALAFAKLVNEDIEKEFEKRMFNRYERKKKERITAVVKIQDWFRRQQAAHKERKEVLLDEEIDTNTASTSVRYRHDPYKIDVLGKSSELPLQLSQEDQLIVSPPRRVATLPSAVLGRASRENWCGCQSCRRNKEFTK